MGFCSSFIFVVFICMSSICEVTIKRELADVHVGVGESVLIDITLDYMTCSGAIESLRYSVGSPLPEWLSEKSNLMIDPPGYYHQTSSGSYDVSVKDGIAYVADYDGGILVLDFSGNISEPELIWSLPSTDNYVALKIVDDRVYALTEDGVFSIFQMTISHSLELVGYELVEDDSVSIIAKQFAIDEVRQFAFVVGTVVVGLENGVVCSIDISDSVNPRVIECVPLFSFSDGEYVFVDPDDSGLYVLSNGRTEIKRFSVDDEGKMLQGITIESERENYSILKKDTFYYIGTTDCLYIYHYIAMIWGVLGSVCEGFGSSTKIAFYGQDYVVANSFNGVYLIDTSDLVDPKVVYTYDNIPSGAGRNGIFIEGNIFYLPIIDDGIYAAKITSLEIEGTNNCDVSEEDTVEVSVRVRASDNPGSYTDEIFTLGYDCSDPVIQDVSGTKVGRVDWNAEISLSFLGVSVFLCLTFSCCVIVLFLCCCIVTILCLVLPVCSGICVFGYRCLVNGKGNLEISKAGAGNVLRGNLLLGGEESCHDFESEENIAKLKINEALFTFKSKEIKLIKILGEGGSSSTVYLADFQGTKVAFKGFRTVTLCQNQNNFDEFEKEVSILGSLSHPNTLRFYGAILEPPRIGIVMEYCPHGDLCVFLRNYRETNESSSFYPMSEKIERLFEVAKAMRFLHSRNIIHRDLKCENILISEDQHSKVMDFGCSRLVERMSVQKTQRIGTRQYMAPEIVLGTEDGVGYDTKVDVFSFSIVVFTVFSERFHDPYGETNMLCIELKVANDPEFRPDPRNMKLGLNKGENIPQWIIDLAVRCWSHEPSRRYDFDKICRIFRKDNMK